jgi:O-antigen ligase
MKHLLPSSNLWHKKVLEDYYPFLVYLYAFLITFPKNMKAVSLIALTGIWLVTLLQNPQSLRGIFRNRIVLSFLLLYSLYILGVLYSSNKGDALDFLALQIPIPLLPFLFYGKVTRKQAIRACVLFTAGIALVSVYAYYKVYTEHFNSFEITLYNLKNLDWAYFSFMLPITVKFHAPYFSLYMCAGLLVLLYLLLFEPAKTKVKIINLAVIIYFLIFIALLSSRTAFFGSIVTSCVLITINLLKRKKPLVLYTMLIGISIFAFGAYKSIPYLHAKVSNFSGVSDREQMWNSALQIIAEHPILGVGTGDHKAALVKSYKDIGFKEGGENNMNAHNQYLDIAVSTGLLGLFLFIISFYFIIRSAIANQDILLFSFILLFTICCITEALLFRQFGVFIFSFFCSILGVTHKSYHRINS